MALFPLKPLSQTGSLENLSADHKEARRVEQFRVGKEAVYFPAFPGDRYLPYNAVTRVRSKNTAISVIGTCGKQIPMVLVRLYYDGEEFYKDFMFEKQKSADQLLEAVLGCCPDVPLERDTTPFGS